MMDKKKCNEQQTMCFCEFCRKLQKHDISRDGIMMYFTCQVCGKSVEFGDRGRR